MEVANNYTFYFKQQKLTPARLNLLILGTLITWCLLINLLQVNFDLDDLSFSNSNVISEETASTSKAAEPKSIPGSETDFSAKAAPREASPLLADKTIVHTIAVQPGESLSSIFQKYAIPQQTLASIIHLPLFYNYAETLKPGQKLQLDEKNHQLQKLIYPLNDQRSLIVSQDKHGLHEVLMDHGLVGKAIVTNIVIHGSLYNAVAKAGVDAAITKNLFNLFKSQIDFSRDIHAGDRLKLVYVELYNTHDKPVRSGAVLAAEFLLSTRDYTAIRVPEAKENSAYYTVTGSSLEKAFLRAPLHYKYISSPFNLHRIHPILHIVRPHYGVDLAAPAGTPIHAASDGIIASIGRMGGYGNVITLKHNAKYSTRYAHMQRFAKKLHQGSYVKEGQVIGYVGESGLATGPHLHYEFRVNGKPVNPMTVKLPDAAPISRKQRLAFLSYVQALKQAYHF